MKRVYKYPVPMRSTKFSIPLPRSFKFLRIGFQADILQMWAEVSPEEPKLPIDFQVFGTGQDMPDGLKYLATYDNGPFVLHLFQVTPTWAPHV